MLPNPSSEALMLNTFPYRRLRLPIALAGWSAVAGLLLLVAGCAGGSNADNSDNGKTNNGFYGTVIGGGSAR
jgi:hypothetical protein